jgi:beta-glucuronidase
MHEDHVTIGKAHNDAMWLRDFELLKWVGANSFRTSHYPYSENVMDMADREGFLVIDETPAVGMNLNVMGGIFGQGDKLQTFSPKTISDDGQALHAQMIRELQARDKNRPGVVIWSVADELRDVGRLPRVRRQPIARS